MITVGTDVHKRTHTFAAVNELGGELAGLTVDATVAGHRRAIAWAQKLAGGQQIKWAIEDCRNMSGRLERDLLAAGQSCVRVTPHLMAGARRSGRVRGKSDPIDALAVARAAQREPDLPVAAHDPLTRDLKLLTDHRDHVVALRTSLINRLRWHLHEIDPEFDIDDASLITIKHQDRVKTWLADRQDDLQGVLAAEIIADIATLTERVKDLDKRLRKLADPVTAALQNILGCATVTAAKILGETANITRFANEDKYARYCGIAPVPVWSGRTAGRVRLTRSGNRQLNRAVHTIALTQIRTNGSLGRTYYEKKQAEGKSNKEALRCLKRRLLRVVYQALVADHQHRSSTTNPVAA